MSCERLPQLASKAVGDALHEVMQRHSSTQLLVLCGHTHGGGKAQILRNLELRTGEAKYGHPAIQEVFEVR